MTDQTAGAEGVTDVSPTIFFSASSRAAPDAVHSAAPDVPGTHVDDAGLQRRLADIETTILRLGERFDQLEFVIVEQFEPGMAQVGDMPAGNLRDRLDRIEAAVGQLSPEPQAAPMAPEVASVAETVATSAPDADPRLDGIMARLADREDEEARRTARLGEIDMRLAGLERAVADLVTGVDTRHEALLTALEGIARRPAPAPDLTAQHRSFAGFATALQTALGRYEASVDRILDRLDAATGRLDALEAGSTTQQAAPSDAASGDAASGGLDASLGALCDRIGALTRVLGSDREGATERALAAVSARLDHLSDVISPIADARSDVDRSSIAETLGDLRMAVAEIAAENRRLRVG